MQHRVTIRQYDAKCAAERRQFPELVSFAVEAPKNNSMARKAVEKAVAEKVGAGRSIRSIAHVVGGGFEATVSAG